MGHVAVDHQADDFVGIQLPRRAGGDPLAVPHDGDVVRDAQNFVHLVGDIDDADALFRQPLHDAEQVLHLVFRQGGGGLVQHQDLRVVGDGLGDLHHLAAGNGQRADPRARIDVDLQILENRTGFLIHPAGVDKNPT